MINYHLPNRSIFDKIDAYHTAFDKKGISPDARVGFILQTFYSNAQTMASRGIDFWLSFGGTLPAVERVIAIANGESETEFYRRTGYPKAVVEAYSIIDKYGVYNDFGTLVFADEYKNDHLKAVPANTSVWQLNGEGAVIDLNLFENRLTAI